MPRWSVERCSGAERAAVPLCRDSRYGSAGRRRALMPTDSRRRAAVGARTRDERLMLAARRRRRPARSRRVMVVAASDSLSFTAAATGMFSESRWLPGGCEPRLLLSPPHSLLPRTPPGSSKLSAAAAARPLCDVVRLVSSDCCSGAEYCSSGSERLSIGSVALSPLEGRATVSLRPQLEQAPPVA